MTMQQREDISSCPHSLSDSYPTVLLVSSSLALMCVHISISTCGQGPNLGGSYNNLILPKDFNQVWQEHVVLKKFAVMISSRVHKVKVDSTNAPTLSAAPIEIDYRITHKCCPRSLDVRRYYVLKRGRSVDQ